MQDSEPSNCSAKAQSPLPKNLYSCAPAVIETVMVYTPSPSLSSMKLDPLFQPLNVPARDTEVKVV